MEARLSCSFWVWVSLCWFRCSWLVPCSAARQPHPTMPGRSSNSQEHAPAQHATMACSFPSNSRPAQDLTPRKNPPMPAEGQTAVAVRITDMLAGEVLETTWV